MAASALCAFAFAVSFLLAVLLAHICRARNRLDRALKENRKALADALAAKSAKNQFFATMSHEVRTPLNALVGFSECLAQAAPDRADVKEYTDGIVRSSQALLALVTDVLDLTRLEMGTCDLLDGACDVKRIVREVTALFEDAARAKGLTLVTRLPNGEFPAVGLAAARLRQILLILLGNAVKFTEKGRVECRLDVLPWADGNVSLDLAVRDTGIGMAPAARENLFNPFVQSITDRGGKVYQGTGLGLPILHRLVTRAGGTVRVDSEPGSGSTFTVHFDRLSSGLLKGEKFPADLADSADGAKASQSASSAKSAGDKNSAEDKKSSAGDKIKPWSDLRVVIADDVPLNLRILALQVHSLGVESVSTATTSQEALDLVREHGADLVLIDVWMPGMSGAELARRLRDDVNFRHIPVVAVTADADPDASFDMTVFRSVVTKPLSLAKTRAIFDTLFPR